METLSLEACERLLSQKRSTFDRNLGTAKALNIQRKELQTEIESLSEQVELYQKAEVIIQKLTQEVQRTFMASIESQINYGLQAVFGVPILFHVEPKVRNSQVTLDFKLVNPDGAETDVTDARGGGLLAVCGVLFRLILVRMLKGRVRQVIILDEALAMLSVEYRAAAGELLAKMASDLGIQILLVSHQTEVNEYADAVYHLASRNGVASIA